MCIIDLSTYLLHEALVRHSHFVKLLRFSKYFYMKINWFKEKITRRILNIRAKVFKNKELKNRLLCRQFLTFHFIEKKTEGLLKGRW